MSWKNRSVEDTPLMGEINMIPLVDIMLVLLIVFMVTLPVITHSITVALPQANMTPASTLPDTIQLSVDKTGQLRWNNTPLSSEALARKFQEAAAQNPQPAFELLGDKQVPYDAIMQVVASAKTAGIQKMGLVTQPTRTPHPPASITPQKSYD